MDQIFKKHEKNGFLSFFSNFLEVEMWKFKEMREENKNCYQLAPPSPNMRSVNTYSENEMKQVSICLVETVQIHRISREKYFK